MSRGFGYVVFEDGIGLVDWGLADTRSDVDAHSLRRLALLLNRYRPDFLLLEDHRVKSCRRGKRVRHLLDALASLATTRQVRVVKIAAGAVARAFRPLGALGKQQVAAVIAARHPELRRRLPTPRKPWTSEDRRMSVFDAAALVLTYVGLAGRGAGRRRAS